MLVPWRVYHMGIYWAQGGFSQRAGALFLHPKGPFPALKSWNVKMAKPLRPRWPLRVTAFRPQNWALIKTQIDHDTIWKRKNIYTNHQFWGFILIFGGLPFFPFENSRKPFRNSMRSPHPVQCSWQTDGYCNWLEVELIQVEKYSLEHLPISQGENQQFKYIYYVYN